MSCKTDDLQEALQLVKPAVSVNNILPIMQSYCFTGTCVFAYNDFISIGIALETPFSAAIPGNALNKCVSTIRSGEVTFEAQGDNLILKAGRSKMAFVSQSADEFVLNPLHLTHDACFSMEVDTRFCEALSSAMLSIDTQYFFDVFGSVALSFQKGKPLTLYSTDDQTLTKVEVEGTTCPNTGDFKPSLVLLPNDFCKQFLKLYNHFFDGHNGKVTMSFGETYLHCNFGDGYGWLMVEIPDVDVMPYEEVFAEAMPHTDEQAWFDVDDELIAIFERAAGIHKIAVNKHQSQETLSIREGKHAQEVIIAQETQQHDLVDHWQGGAAPELEVMCNPNHLLRAAKVLNQGHWASGQVIVFRNDAHTTHIISVE
ncbi:hypothetical protein [Pseudoalteromonas umbrosa]|uniref:hypothetical protein n=1 Tax=Pseudoalteromonas umbrosa TaxID=3048489 RepID=UPI0024C3C8A2|nr:hypothetical protein [Pseudoalteromonas sp. B95]MDK1290141.1 hypothetical protein [Pseudoalteromonas sp. B95]